MEFGWCTVFLVHLDQLLGIKHSHWLELNNSDASLRVMRKSTGSPVCQPPFLVQDQEMYREKAQRILQGPGVGIEVYLS